MKTFEYVMENRTFAPLSKCSIFHNIFKYILIQRHQRVLSWKKRLMYRHRVTRKSKPKCEQKVLVYP